MENSSVVCSLLALLSYHFGVLFSILAVTYLLCPNTTPRLSEQVREPEEQSFLTPRKRRNRDRAARDGGGERKPNTSSRRRRTTPRRGVARFRRAFNATKSSRSRYGEDGKGRRRGNDKESSIFNSGASCFGPRRGTKRDAAEPPSRRAAAPAPRARSPRSPSHVNMLR